MQLNVTVLLLNPGSPQRAALATSIAAVMLKVPVSASTPRLHTTTENADHDFVHVLEGFSGQVPSARIGGCKLTRVYRFRSHDAERLSGTQP